MITDFDELNVMSELDTFYNQLDEANRKEFKKLWLDRYEEMLLYAASLTEKEQAMTDSTEKAKSDTGLSYKLSAQSPDMEDMETYADLYLHKILDEPSPVTGYAYTAEVLRKRDRAKEAIIAAPTKLQKQVLFGKHVKYWSRQTGWYSDIVSDEAALRAMKDAGVKLVRWNSMRDHKVCSDCNDRDGKVYAINEVPEKHPGCRCWLSPVN